MKSEQREKKRKRCKLFQWKRFLFDFVRFTGALPTLIALRPKYYYISKRAKKKVRGAALVVANHSDYLDPVKIYLALWYRRVNIVAMRALFAKPSANWFFRSCACIPIDPENPDFHSLNEACTRLNEGNVVGIFPEGHINHTENPLDDFKSGVLLMAMRSHAPIIPVYFCPWRHWYERVRIVIGEPVDVNSFASGERLTIGELDEAAKKIQKKVEELMRFLAKRRKKNV